MPITTLRRPSVLPSRLCVAVLLAWCSAVSAGVEVFTIAGEPVINVPDSSAVVELDAPARLDARISQGLPADPERAQRVLQSHMSGPEWQATLRRYGKLYRGIARAWVLGIEKVPAVVVDSRYVVYGEPDVQAALREIERMEVRPQ
ncbi:TIGR03757 family integrating conjugative element protein [Halomonas sp. McH1-25]|uniref:TIGR03757 family integrating conjugative element protein n=1 Tax=unclassified Halomonas TaxID=2609666 RepID=UPI001EF6000A|nr:MULTISPECIES: TIGR03757 family integrating conjugative element protein [unclassified Halomonas]MCG7601792.1 TIGR03757 family integrating conjugative element protein [Halomonas sp. McH1-25]MCP1343968.1 TIGR03757 family integrating conjugative element protein [Halomonas sp. FL8]MCP1361799.1 TIGR03757 family integrating conjugative element protein [Halomonas sp. BBD45]MCP1364623.1 TIGR03757 family integrating conjugative element protein [Halomonas sp. BBD48]